MIRMFSLSLGSSLLLSEGRKDVQVVQVSLVGSHYLCILIVAATTSASAISVGPAVTTSAAPQPSTVRSDAYTTHGSRGFALAVGVMAIGLTALFYVA